MVNRHDEISLTALVSGATYHNCARKAIAKMSSLISVVLFLIFCNLQFAWCDSDADAQILRSFNNLNEDGSYEYGFETSNGIKIQESGLGGDGVQGTAKWIDNDGTLFQLSYIADENGYQPQGLHLPTPPPIPPLILRALAYNAAHPQRDGFEYKPEFAPSVSTTVKPRVQAKAKASATKFPSFTQQVPLSAKPNSRQQSKKFNRNQFF